MGEREGPPVRSKERITAISPKARRAIFRKSGARRTVLGLTVFGRGSSTLGLGRVTTGRGGGGGGGRGMMTAAGLGGGGRGLLMGGRRGIGGWGRTGGRAGGESGLFDDLEGKENRDNNANKKLGRGGLLGGLGGPGDGEGEEKTAMKSLNILLTSCCCNC